MKINNKRKVKKSVQLFALVLLLGFTSALLYYIHSSYMSPTQQPPRYPKYHLAEEVQPQTPAVQQPPKQNSPEKTPPATDHQSITSSQGSQSPQVTMSISLSDSSVVIRGGINSIAANEGSCYAELTSPQGSTIKYTTSLLRNATTTDCKTIIIPRQQFTAGAWIVTLHYSSATTKGASNAHTITID